MVASTTSIAGMPGAATSRKVTAWSATSAEASNRSVTGRASGGEQQRQHRTQQQRQPGAGHAVGQGAAQVTRAEPAPDRRGGAVREEHAQPDDGLQHGRGQRQRGQRVHAEVAHHGGVGEQEQRLADQRGEGRHRQPEHLPVVAGQLHPPHPLIPVPVRPSAGDNLSHRRYRTRAGPAPGMAHVTSWKPDESFSAPHRVDGIVAGQVPSPHASRGARPQPAAQAVHTDRGVLPSFPGVVHRGCGRAGVGPGRTPRTVASRRPVGTRAAGRALSVRTSNVGRDGEHLFDSGGTA